MKKSFFVFMAMFFAVGMYAQDAYYCLRQGAELIYRSTDAKGRETGTTTIVIKAVTGSDGNYELVQTNEISLSKLDLGKPVAVSVSIKDNNIPVAILNGLAYEFTEIGPSIPSTLSVGQELECGTIEWEVMGIKSSHTVTSHKVVAQEEITTPAGTYDCFVVEQKYTMKSGFAKSEGVNKVWYAKGIGAVKTENYDKKGKKLVVSQQLVIVK